MYVNKAFSFWKHILFSDESKVIIFRSYGIKLVLRQKGNAFEVRNLRLTVKHREDNFTVRDCTSARRLGVLAFVVEIMNPERHLRKKLQKLKIKQLFFPAEQ